MYTSATTSQRTGIEKSLTTRNRSAGRGGLIALAVIAATATGATAATWNYDGDDVWSNAARWTGGVPDAAGAAADLTTTLAADRTITIDGAVDATRIVGTITKSTTFKYTIAASDDGLLVFDNGGPAATITQSAANANKGLTISAPIRPDAALNIDNQVNAANARTLFLSGEVNVNGKTLTNASSGNRAVQISGNLVGSGSIAQNPANSASILILTGDNSSYTGSFSIAAGTTMSTTGTSGKVMNNAANVVAADGTLDLGANNTLIGGMNGAAAGIVQLTSGSGTKTLTLAGTGSYSFAGTIANSSATFGLSKTGGGTQALNGASTYNGPTAVSGGMLLVNGIGSGATSSGTGTGAVNVTGGTLGGTGRILGGVSVAGGATLMAGDGVNAAENLELVGALTMSDGSLLALILDGGGSHSTLTLGGASSFDSNQAVSIIEATPVAANTSFDNIITGVSPSLDVSQWVLTNAGWSGTFTNDGANIDLTVTAIPEPAGLAGLLAGATLLIRRRRGGNRTI